MLATARVWIVHPAPRVWLCTGHNPDASVIRMERERPFPPLGKNDRIEYNRHDNEFPLNKASEQAPSNLGRQKRGTEASATAPPSLNANENENHHAVRYTHVLWQHTQHRKRPPGRLSTVSKADKSQNGGQTDLPQS